MSESWIDQCRAYIHERYPLRMFLPVAIALAAAASTGTRPECWVLSVFLVFQFRLWDDLGDIGFDIVNHKDRVLIKARSHTAFHVLLVSSGLVNLILVTSVTGALLPLLITNAAAFIWYQALPPQWRRSFAGRHLTLLKYPMFVWLLAGEERIHSMVFVYLCATIYELAHDRDMHLHPASTALLTVEVLFLAGLIAVILSGGYL